MFSGLLFSCLVVASMDIMGIALIGFFVGEVFGTGERADVFLFDQIYYFLGSDRNELTLFLIAVFIVKFLLGTALNFFIFYKCAFTEVRLRNALLVVFQSRELQEWQKQSSADYLNITNVWVTQYTRLVLVPLLRLSSEVLIFALLILFLLTVDWRLLSVTGLVFFGLSVAYLWLFQRPNRRYAEKFKVASVNLMNQLVQLIDSYKETKVLGLESFFLRRVRKESEKLAVAVAVSSTISNSPKQYFELALILMFAAIVMVFMGQSTVADEVVPVLSIFALSGVRFVLTISAVMSTVTQLLFNKPIVEKLYSHMKANDFSGFKAMKSTTSSKRQVVPLCHQALKIEISNASFSYKGSKETLFQNLNMTINGGDKIFVTGPSGQGKSTLIEIILGMLPLRSGSIYLNDEDVTHIKNAIRTSAIYVPQRPVMLSDSLRRNIAFAKEDSEIDDVKIMELLKTVALRDFVEILPNSINTKIGADGIELSGGQRQRIALARALYSEKSLIILDEATSALDVETEQEVVRNMLAYASDKTILFISHRKSLAKMFSRSVTVKDGNILSA